MGGESTGEGKVPKAIDDGEEQMLKTSKDKLEEEEKKDKEQREAEEEDDDWWTRIRLEYDLKRERVTR